MSEYGLQERIIHFLQSKSCQIDPYDGGIIPHDELDEFSANVKKAIEQISSEGENWSFTPIQLETYYRVGDVYQLDLLPPRDQVCADLSRMLEVVETAKKSNFDVIFQGD